MMQPRKTRRRVRIGVIARQHSMRQQLPPEQNVSPQIGIAMLPRVRNHYREQDQSRRVAKQRYASRVGGHRCITARLVPRRESSRCLAARHCLLPRMRAPSSPSRRAIGRESRASAPRALREYRRSRCGSRRMRPPTQTVSAGSPLPVAISSTRSPERVPLSSTRRSLTL